MLHCSNIDPFLLFAVHILVLLFLMLWIYFCPEFITFLTAFQVNIKITWNWSVLHSLWILTPCLCFRVHVVWTTAGAAEAFMLHVWITIRWLCNNHEPKQGQMSFRHFIALYSLWLLYISSRSLKHRNCNFYPSGALTFSFILSGVPCTDEPARYPLRRRVYMRPVDLQPDNGAVSLKQPVSPSDSSYFILSLFTLWTKKPQPMF